jgi:retron-type reverse transcriptase
MLNNRQHFIHKYNDIISLRNLHEAWAKFVRGKKYKKDVAEFSLNLSRNIFILHETLRNRTYTHGKYEAFKISDPKPRDIHKATVRDRLLHHAMHRILYTYFDKRFIYDSYSCRNLKGTHRAINRFLSFYRKVSRNSTNTCWVLKCDIRKFFASVNHKRLFEIIRIGTFVE